MTHSKYQKIKILIFLTFLVNIAICVENISEKRTEEKGLKPEHQKGNETHSVLSNNDNNKTKPPEIKTKTNGKESNSTKVTPKPPESNSNSTHPQPSNGVHMSSFNSGALVRGFYVFVGLSVLVMLYIVFRSLRLNKTRAQIVRKYGVLANRQDVEMRPLPLDEDDEDDTTVFDASNISSRNMHQ